VLPKYSDVVELNMAELQELDPQELRDVAASLGLLTHNELTPKEVFRILDGAQLDEAALGT
jgi:hypothetical protein